MRAAPVSDDAEPATSPNGAIAALLRFGMRNMNSDSDRPRSGMNTQNGGWPPVATLSTTSRTVPVESVATYETSNGCCCWRWPILA